MNKVRTRGRFTLPAQTGMDNEVIRLAEKWGVDIVRDSDGTVLSPDIMKLGFQVYSTLCMIRADQDWAKARPDHCQQKFIMSEPVTAVSDTLDIDVLAGYSKEQFKADTLHDPKKYWEVINRTTGKVIDTALWAYDDAAGKVTIQNTEKWCVYTVNVLVYQIWETTSMYNYITNDWEGEHQMGLDPRQPETYDHLMQFLEGWLKSHGDTDWVRFTSVAYQFPIITNEQRKTRYQDWCGYLDPVSALALDEFEKEYGYRLRSEHLVDKGYYNSTNNVPSGEYLDWINFVNKFIIKFSRDCNERVHKAGKKSILFFCDHWIGTEPYDEARFAQAGYDAIVGPCINGKELRRIADVPGSMTKEVRLYPYFFPVNLKGEPSFKEGGDPVGECRTYWMKIRRAMMRNCVDRIGFGGYLDLAVKYPEFLDYVEKLAGEFRDIVEKSQMTAPYTPSFKVGILNAWGKRRSWIFDQTWPDGGIMEAMSGLPVDIEFLNFDDIKDGVPRDIGVLINMGKADSAWSGGHHWTNPEVVSAVREFVHTGGGFIGVIEPTAYEHGGQCFQLSDVLGVQRELGFSSGRRDRITPHADGDHFILKDTSHVDLGYVTDAVYVTDTDTEVLAVSNGTPALTTRRFGQGRSVYLNGFALSSTNTRILLRAIFWAAGRPGEMSRWFSTNPEVEVAAYEEAGTFAVLNNSDEARDTTVTDAGGKTHHITLESHEIKWLSI